MCETCEGTGFISDFENQAPLGSGMTWLEEIWNDCPDCLGENKCPKCNQENTIDWDADILTCLVCKWEDEQ